MGVGLKRRTRQLIDMLGEDNRYVDIAVQFEVYERRDELGPGPGGSYPTGERSKIYGGKYDKWRLEYVGPPEIDPIVLPCSAPQFEVVTSDALILEGNGGRGAGKSESGILRTIRFVAERPCEKGEIVSPTFDLTKNIWNKILPIFLQLGWLLPGRMGIRKIDRALHFIHGVRLRFRSADNPDSLRSWGGGWAFVDEEQDVSSEAISVIWPSLRESRSLGPRMWCVGTPKDGEYRDRHEERLNDPENSVVRFDSFTNPFVDQEVFKKARLVMTQEMYEQEILAKWIQSKTEYVCRREFSPKIHGVDYPTMVFGQDVTKQITELRLRAPYSYVAGVDYQLANPNVAWVYKVFRNNTWVVIDIVKAAGEAGNLAQALSDAGYMPRDTLVIDDASGEYNRYSGRRSANSSARLMRQMGYTCVHPNKNPLIKDRVNALLPKLKPAEGNPTWYYNRTNDYVRSTVEQTMKRIRWKKDQLNKDDGVDHDFDAGTYPIHFFCPPATSWTTRLGRVNADSE